MTRNKNINDYDEIVELGNRIINTYCREIFGKISKHEVDLIVFGSLGRTRLSHQEH